MSEVVGHDVSMAPKFSRACSEAARRANVASADAWAHDVAKMCETLRKDGHLTYADQAAELNRRGICTRRGLAWTAQSVYLRCRRDRVRQGHAARTSRETREIVDGRWRNEMRAKVLELKSYGVTRYVDLAKALNEEGVDTRLGKRWSKQSIDRLMRNIGLQRGKPGRYRHDE